MSENQNVSRSPGRPRRGQRRRSVRDRLQDDRDRQRRNRMDQSVPSLLSEHPYPNEMFHAASVFDQSVSRMRELSCTNCNRTSTELSMVTETMCTVCHRSSNKFTAYNNMDPGSVPPELMNLSYIEQMVIAQVHPVVSLYKIAGAQFAYHGNVINFRQDISTYTTLLPIHPSQLDCAILFNRTTPSGLAQFQASASKIRAALVWLKNNNEFYHNIEISESNLSAIGEQGDLSQYLSSLNIESEPSEERPGEESIEESFVPQLRNMDQRRQICDILQVPYPQIETNPVNEFSDEGYIAKAFPALFPHGKADLLAARPIPVTVDEYFKYLLMYKDRRFAKDPRFRFFAMNTVMRRFALSRSNVFIRKNVLDDLNVTDLSLRIQRDPSFINQLMVYSASLRSTKPYWRQRCAELLKMVDQIGLPTIFFTLSAADYHWNDLFRLLAPDVPDANSISNQERRTLMHDNPMIVANFFQQRCGLFLKNVLKPVFKVEDFWYRFEWQWRGSPHLHGLLWIKDAPSLNDTPLSEPSLERIRLYFDQLCSAINPFTPTERLNKRANIHPSRMKFSDVEDYQEDLGYCLNTFQRHTKHSARSCLKTDSRTGRMVCRFNFPIEEELESRLGEDNGYLQFFPQRNDPLMARYNRFVTQVWRANTDFSPIVSSHAVLQYIAKYASKGEHASSFYCNNIREILQASRQEAPARSVIQRFLCSAVGERDYSAQEVVHVVMGWPLYRASRIFVSLVINNEQWNSLPRRRDDEEGRQSRNIIEKYCSRPNCMADMKLIDFAKFVYIDRAGAYKTRGTAAIVRVFPVFKLSGDYESDEKYYMQQCILNCPFRCERFDILLRIYEQENWRSLHNHLNILHEEGLDFPLDDDPLSDLLTENDPILEPYMANAAAGPIINNAELGYRLVDVTFDWQTVDRTISFDEVKEFLRSFRQNVDATPMRNQDRALNFSPDQQEVLNILDSQIQSLQGGRRRVTRSMQRNINHVKRVVIQGKAGSGKSTLIKEIVARVEASFGPESIVVCAPTGVAANNINGSTIHSLLRISISNILQPLNGERLMEFQQKFQNLKFLIIDEMSMIGARLLGKIDRRCKEMHPEDVDPFGGLHIYLFGDYRQLPPVKNAAVYRPNTRNNQDIQDGLVVFRSFQRFIELTSCHRQRDGSAQFRRLLDHLADGSFDREDYDLLMTRKFSILSNTETQQFNRAIHLFCQNKQVIESNRNYLSNLNNPVARIRSENNPDVVTTEAEDVVIGLPFVLNLAIDCRVMLRTNIWVEGGLVNGSLGTVKSIVYEVGSQPSALPLYILVEFDDYRGPFIQERLFPVLPIVRSFSRHNSTYTRKQFPLALAYAITIHKSQGLTLSKIAVDIGENEAALGLTYVALSRVRKLEDIALIRPYNQDRFVKIFQKAEFRERQAFIQQYWS